MPWDSIGELPEAIRNTLPSNAQQIFLNTFNSAWDSDCKNQTNRETCAMQRAWGAVKRLYKKEGNKWIIKASIHSPPIPFIVASAGNPHTISGPLIEIGKVNLNNWGIPLEEVESIKAGLLGMPLKICSGNEAIFDQHACDYNWDPGAAIGQIIAAHQENGWIHATAKVTDPIAQSKIGSGTWTNKWSIFGGYKFEDLQHMRYGTIPRSVTLVDDPAYPGAGFKQAASKSSLNDKENGSMKDKDNEDPKTYTKEELDKQVAEAVAAEQATINQMTQQQEELTQTHEDAFAASKKENASTLEAKDKEIADLQAAAKKDQEGDQDDTVPKSEVENMIAASKDGMVPREEVEKMISAATEAAEKNAKDLMAREVIADSIVKMQASFNIIKPDETEETKTKLMDKSVAALDEDKALLENMGAALEAHSAAAVDKFKELNLPTGSQSSGSDLGTWDPYKKEWT